MGFSQKERYFSGGPHDNEEVVFLGSMLESPHLWKLPYASRDQKFSKWTLLGFGFRAGV